MRIVFLGTPDFAVPTLRALIRSRHEVCAVFTQPDRPAGRGQIVHPPPVKVVATECGIPVFQPQKIRAEENRPIFERLRPEFIVVAAFGQILPPWLLGAARLAPVNVHASLLPKYRGAAPIAWAILNGEPVTGITTMLMDERLDTGAVLLKQEVPVTDWITAGELEAELAAIGADLLIQTLEGLENDSVRPVPQDQSAATYAPKITKDMARICWEQDAHKIHNLVRAFNPWPLAFTEYRGQKLQILRSAPEPSVAPAVYPPGTFLGATAGAIRVQCGSGSILQLVEVQPASKRAMTGCQFAAGARLGKFEPLFQS
jgi:methionyl-tRNA formyltransferase